MFETDSYPLFFYQKKRCVWKNDNPIGSMYGILAYIWSILMANVGCWYIYVNIPYMDAMGTFSFPQTIGEVYRFHLFTCF